MQIIDIEASGLRPESYPIEIGVYDVDNPNNSFDFFIKPDPEWTFWDDRAEEIHGIPRECIETKGISIYRACEILNARLGANVLSDAVSFDSMWLDRLFETANATPVFKVRSVYEFVHPSYITDFEHYLFENDMPHRALEDAKIIGEIVKKFRHRN